MPDELGIAVLNSMAARIAVLDDKGVIVAVNEAWRSFTGDGRPSNCPYCRGGVGTNYLDRRYWEAADPVTDAMTTLQRIQRLLEGRAPLFSQAYCCRCVDEKRCFVMTVTPLRTGDIQGAVVHHTDQVPAEKQQSYERGPTTGAQRNRAELAALANEVRLQTFLDHATDGLFLHDATARVVDVNQQACESLGYTRAELIGMMPAEFDPHAAGSLTDWVCERLDAGETVAFDSQHRRKDGSTFPVEVRIRPFWVDDKRFGFALVRDITERKQAEANLRNTQQRLALILEHANVGLWDWNVTTNEVEFSREWKSQLGYDEDEIANQYDEWQSRVHSEDLPGALASVNNVISNKESDYEAEFRMRHKNGTWRWILARGKFVPDSSGVKTNLAGVQLDITERKNAESIRRQQVRILERIATGDALHEVLEDIVTLVEEQMPTSLCSILLLGEDGRLGFGAGRNLPRDYSNAIDGIRIGASVGSCGTAAYLKKTVIVSDILTDPLWDDYRELAVQYDFRSCWSEPIFAEGASGKAKCGLVLGTFALYGRKPSTPTDADLQIVSAAANLAGIAIERHRAEGAIRDSEDRLRTLLENLQNVAVQAYEPDGTITFWNNASERVFGYSTEEALGRDIVALLHDENTGADERRIMTEALRTGNLPPPEQGDVLRRDGQTITVLTNRVLHRRPGREPEFFCFDVDVTDKMRAEEESTLRRAELFHASRLSTLGQMVAALSHEVAQPLTAIGNFASASDQILEHVATAPSTKLRDYIHAIVQQNERCSAILQRLRDFSRRARPQRSPCDLRQLVNDSVDLVEYELRRQNVSVRQELDVHLPMIVADRIQLQQVVVNLLTNACDAVRRQPSARRAITIRAAADENHLELFIDDMGAGFAPDIANRLFEPFFTTKHEGMGIGLNVCESIVQSHGGQLSAHKNDQGGATFRVRLPLRGAV